MSLSDSLGRRSASQLAAAIRATRWPSPRRRPCFSFGRLPHAAGPRLGFPRELAPSDDDNSRDVCARLRGGGVEKVTPPAAFVALSHFDKQAPPRPGCRFRLMMMSPMHLPSRLPSPWPRGAASAASAAGAAVVAAGAAGARPRHPLPVGGPAQGARSDKRGVQAPGPEATDPSTLLAPPQRGLVVTPRDRPQPTLASLLNGSPLSAALEFPAN